MGVENLLCPNTTSLAEKYKLKNLFSHVKDRTAVSFEIIACNDEFIPDCKNESEIRSLLDHLVITQYFVTEGVDFKNEENFGKRPITNELRFYQQFQLNFDLYRDNNNFVRQNKVETEDERNAIFHNEQEYSYLDIFAAGPTWIGKQLLNTE